MKILFVAGGSGGHITPALAVADSICNISPATEIVFVSSQQKLDRQVFDNHVQKYRLHTITSVKFRRYFSWQNIRDIFRLPKVLWQAWTILQKEAPDILFSKGGYVALPLGLIAKIKGIPLIIHESDAAAGMSNFILQKFAVKILTTFPSPQGKCVGTPIRKELRQGDKEKGLSFLNFSQKKPIVFITGGSQGAEVLNKFVLLSLSVLQKHCHIVHLYGAGKSAASNSQHYRAFAYLGKELPDVLCAADIVVSRAGANSLFEIATAAKPLITIPLPSAANDHQRKNAAFFAEKNAAIVLEETKLTSHTFQNTILSLLTNKKLQQSLKKNIQLLAPKDASERIAKVILEFKQQ